MQKENRNITLHIRISKHFFDFYQRISSVFDHRSNFLRSATRYVFLLAFPLISLSFYSCLNEEVCEDVATVPVRVGFYEVDTASTTPAKISLDSLTLYGLGKDSIIYNNQLNVSQVEFPLNSIRDSCAFILRMPDVEGLSVYPYDTLWFYYRRIPNLISMDCGFVTFYDLTSVTYTTNHIDSLVIEDSNVSNSIDEHIKIFPAVADTFAL